jgi:hypothetical protein
MRTIEFEGPERIAMGLPDPHPNDFAWGWTSSPPEWEPSRTSDPDGRETWQDEWGNTWARLGRFSKGQVVEGALRDWSQLDDYQMPGFDDPARYQSAKAHFASHSDRFRIGDLPGFPFSIMRYLRRMDVFLEDLLAHPDEVNRLRARVVPLLARCIQQWAAAGADAVMFGEDWGTQERLLISPALWREIFKPDFMTLCAAARRHGLSVFMHSCGYLYDIIPDLIECGIAVLQFDQPLLYGLDRLAEFGGRVTFWCPVDIQQVLPTGDADLIEASAREMVEKLGAFGGGFIAGYYGDMPSIGVRPEWQELACRAFVKYGGMHGAMART